MIRKKAMILGFVFILILVSAYASACTPDYVCKDWGACSNGIQLRTCADRACGQADIADRRLCGNETVSTSCTVKYSCDEWSSCTYYDKTNDIVGSQIKYSGVETRFCADTAGCADSFSEERACADSFKVNFVKIQQCGMDFLVAQDLNSKRSVAQVNLNAWRQQFLDISFIQSNFSYCPSCYNGFRDGDETGIDCGGSCMACKAEDNKYPLLVFSSWVLSLGLFFSFIGTFVGDKNYVLRFILYRAYIAIERRDMQSLRKLAKRVNSLYSQLPEGEKQGYVKEVSRFRDRLADFRIRISRED